MCIDPLPHTTCVQSSGIFWVPRKPVIRNISHPTANLPVTQLTQFAAAKQRCCFAPLCSSSLTRQQNSNHMGLLVIMNYKYIIRETTNDVRQWFQNGTIRKQHNIFHELLLKSLATRRSWPVFLDNSIIVWCVKTCAAFFLTISPAIRSRFPHFLQQWKQKVEGLNFMRRHYTRARLAGNGFFALSHPFVVRIRKEWYHWIHGIFSACDRLQQKKIGVQIF